MYGIYANIWGILMVNVTIYSIHGSCGKYFLQVIPILKHYSDIVSDIASGSVYGIEFWHSTWHSVYLRRFFALEVRGPLWSWVCCSGPAGTTAIERLQLRSGGEGEGGGGQLTENLTTLTWQVRKNGGEVYHYFVGIWFIFYFFGVL